MPRKVGRARRVAALAACLILLCSIAPHAPRIPAPGLILWAWERPEDLRFINPATTGVAYLAATATILPTGDVSWHFRQQPLATPPRTARIAVVRIESPPRFIFPAPAPLAASILAATTQRDVIALQIDYDARTSERPFYTALLQTLRARTPLPIGITALASWCAGDPWLNPALISEAVPMFFRMGRNESKPMRLTAPLCRNAIGISTDEAWPEHPTGRIYIFNPQPWTQAEYEMALKRLAATP